MKTQKIDTPNGAIAVHESAGQGPPVVLIHGNSSSSRAFSRQLEGPLGSGFAWSRSICLVTANRLTRRTPAPIRFLATPARFGRS